jgi:SsrA-binding protein
MKLVTDNRKARFDYLIEDKYEAGLELFGWEVKSARAGGVNLQDSFVFFTKAAPVQCFLKNAHFSHYEYGDVKTQDARRDRRLLLNRSQINKFCSAVKTKGYTCVATKIYFNARNRVKVEIALAKGKHKFDKKKTLKEKDIARETARSLKAVR